MLYFCNIFMTFCVIVKKTWNYIFSLITTPFFQKKTTNNQKIILSCSRNHRIIAGRCFSVIFIIFRPKTATIFLRKKYNIKAETNKTPTTVDDLTRKSRFRYIKVWIYSISVRKHILKFWKFKNIWSLCQIKC